MRFKYYLRGISLGIIFTTIIMIVSIQMHGGIMTDEKAMKKAAELGMEMPKNQEIQTEQEAQTEQETLTNQETQMVDKSQTDETTETLTETSTEIPNELVDDESNSDVDTADVVITVEKGDVCRMIAQKLQDNQLVEDAEEFRKYMYKHKYDQAIQTGEYIIPRNSSFEEIAKILTSK